MIKRLWYVDGTHLKSYFHSLSSQFMNTFKIACTAGGIFLSLVFVSTADAMSYRPYDNYSYGNYGSYGNYYNDYSYQQSYGMFRCPALPRQSACYRYPSNRSNRYYDGYNYDSYNYNDNYYNSNNYYDSYYYDNYNSFDINVHPYDYRYRPTVRNDDYYYSSYGNYNSYNYYDPYYSPWY
ncbi:MAG TPA: hypothetical protein VI913_05100 [Candidatus Peribacteraceae bacterium]|nr:hypothetical protein [Candidatus Peribacteraceae bacterium]